MRQLRLQLAKYSYIVDYGETKPQLLKEAEIKLYYHTFSYSYISTEAVEVA